VARALLAAPLITKGHTIGAIEVANKKVGTFDRGDQRLLEALSLSAAAAIENARLYERIQRQALQQESMIRVGHAMSSAGDVDTVLQQIVELALAAIPAAFTAAVHLADQEQEILNLHCYAGRPLWDTMKEPFPLPQGVAGHVFVTRQAANVGNVMDDPRYISGPGRVVYHSMLVAPLIVNDSPLGTLSVNGLEPHAFGYDDEQMIRGLAAQAAVALRNASLLESLRESETRYRGLVENANALLIITDSSGVITFAGGRWAAMTGYEAGEVTGRSYQDMVHPQDWPDLAKQVSRLQASPSRLSDLRYRITHRDGSVRWHQSSAVSYGDASGQVERIYAVVHDVTARVQAEQAAAHRAEQLAALNAIASSISCSLDPDDVVLDGLRKLMSLLRLDAAGLGLLDPGQDHIAPHTVIGFSPEILEFIALLQKDGHIPPASERKPFMIPDLTTHPPLVRSAGLSMVIQREGMRTLALVPVVAQDKAIGVLFMAACASNAISASDLELLATVGQQFGVALHNAQVYAQAEDRAVHLEVANRYLRDLARRKSQFVQNTSHELRTPLTFVRSYAELLLDGGPGPLSDQQRRMLEIMYAKSRVLVDLVNDISSLLDIELGPEDVSEVDLRTLLQRSLNDHQEQAEQAGIVLETDWPEGPLIIRGNQDRLLQTFHHLFDNAIKFSPDGGCVRTRVWTQDRNVFIEMSDQGVGIPPDQHEFIFDRFYQVDGSAVRRFGGTGLGLAIVKETIQAHGGMIQVQSDGIPGEGSAFTITLPLPRR
jgi:PAS domain S-box-containing protein